MLHLVTQLWCAAGVNLSGGKTRDGGSIVGASVFYSDASVPESPKKKVGSQSSVEKLDQELKVQPHFYSSNLPGCAAVWVQVVSSDALRTSRRSIGIRTSCPLWCGSAPAPSPPPKPSSSTPTSPETSWTVSWCATRTSSASPVFRVSDTFSQRRFPFRLLAACA